MNKTHCIYTVLLLNVGCIIGKYNSTSLRYGV